MCHSSIHKGNSFNNCIPIKDIVCTNSAHHPLSLMNFRSLGSARENKLELIGSKAL